MSTTGVMRFGSIAVYVVITQPLPGEWQGTAFVTDATFIGADEHGTSFTAKAPTVKELWAAMSVEIERVLLKRIPESS